MARGDHFDGDAGDEDNDAYSAPTDVGDDGGQSSRPPQEPLPSVPDTRLTDLLRADIRRSQPALRELRGRHRPTVLTYARLCTVDEPAARRLTSQAFTAAARETARGLEPRTPWRHQLLLFTARLTADWAADERALQLDPGLLTHLRLSGAGPEGPVPPMLPAFLALPTRVQGLVWYAVVDEEPDMVTARFLGVSPEDVAYGRDGAFQALRQAVLRTRLAGSDDPRCQDFRRLIEQAVHPDHPRHSADLSAHMAHCPHCSAGYRELAALRDTPRTALAEGLLPWGGTAYTMSVGAGAARRPNPSGAPGRHTSTVAPAGGTHAGARARAPRPAWRPSRGFALASAALGVAVAPLLVYLLTSGGSAAQAPAGAVGTPANPPSVTVTSTPSPPSVSPSGTASSPEPSVTPSKTTEPPSPTPTLSPTPTPTRSKAPAFRPPGGSATQVVNVASALCLDVDGDFENGTDVVTAACSSSPTQRWRVDSARGALVSFADPSFCLDSRGSVGAGVGIWDCASLDGDNAENLRFAVDGDGVITPAIAPDHALAPGSGTSLDLAPADGGTAQRWKAGAGPS